MTVLHCFNVGVFVVMMLIICCDGKAEIGDYIVDCSACSYLPLRKVDSYHCNVRCEANGEYKR